VAQRGKQITEDEFSAIKKMAREVTTRYGGPPDDERKRVLRGIADRQGQPAFRTALLDAYDTHCAITDCDAENALEAAHLDPYVNAASNHPSNGLLLRSDIHTLFDLKLLAINPSTLKVVLANRLLKTSYADLQDQPVSLPQAPNTSPIKTH